LWHLWWCGILHRLKKVRQPWYWGPVLGDRREHYVSHCRLK
jgi:hypothetical protein